jgi:hypothetical protein
MHDRNGAPLRPGELVRYRSSEVDVTGEVMRAGGDGMVVVAIPMPLPSGRSPMVGAAFDQMLAAGRNAGAPSDCVPAGLPSHKLEKL